jgi:feruloyl esterase
MAGATPYPYTVPFYRNLVFKDPQWDYKTRPVNFAADVDAADSPQNAVINALNPDLSGFVARGGKLLLVGGWNDHTLGPGNNVHYYESVVAKMGADKMGDHVRLFMVPGMDHCFGLAYPTADTFDLDVVSTLKAWRTSGKAPDRLVVTQANVGTASRKRLVCAYPRLAIYSGTGSVDDPASFSCRQPEER